MLPTLHLCVSLAGLSAEAPAAPIDPRRLIEWTATRGARGVRLDASVKGFRARELDRSARRHLASLLKRLELRFAGVDLWIPSEHFHDPARADRAVSAVAATLELCGDLATLTDNGAGRSVSIALPKDSDEAGRSLAQTAERAGVRIADHGEGAETRAAPGGWIGVGLDPAVLLARAIDPVAEVSRLLGASGSRLVSARLSDTDGIGRVTPGQGRLDVMAYAAALATHAGSGEMVLDLRGVRDQERAIADAIEAWERTGIGSR